MHHHESPLDQRDIPALRKKFLRARLLARQEMAVAFFPGFGEHKVQMSNRYLSAAPRTVAAAPVAASNFNTLPTITFYGSQRTVMNAPLGLHSLGDVSADGDNVFAGAGDQETQADNDWEYYYEEEEEE
mmetsp:Transcript_39564/g.64723  ORF Transcript_39564/g.64723 Transcript_39564/m.64723 type:complete len:129 (+) Transcript_39564:856-1242(+)